MNLLQKNKYQGLKKKAQKFYAIRKAEQQGNPDIAAEIKLHYELAKFYEDHRYDSDLPQAEVFAFESYRLAAILGDVRAQYLCGKKLLEKGRFWEGMAQTMYGCQAHSKYAYEYFKEGLSYLETAEQNGHMPAKRLRGLAFMQGWGLPKDYDLGFNLIVASIDEEKTWDSAKEILQGIGLDASEFFAKLAAKKHS
jgi:TPR repeat protein